MFAPKADRKWSEAGLAIAIGSLVLALALAAVDGLVKSYYIEHMHDSPMLTAVATWVVDFRYVAEQTILAGVVLFVGAKFFETRTIFTIGFDKLDAAKIAVTGPDENNIVWIGHRYGTQLEAEAVAATMAERLKESAISDANS
jgi:hypothetical protein